MCLSFEKPEKLEPEKNKPFANANADYPLISIDHRRFEKLIYWIYRTEIEQGDWKHRYDDIQLMSGVRDGGKDCSIYRNKDIVGVIQCKHSENGTRLSEPNFVKEIIKFGLYCIKSRNLISNPGKFEYYIASSCGFEEACLNFITNFKKQIIAVEKFEKWTKSIISSNDSLKDLDYSIIEKPLKEFLTTIAVIKIDEEEINRLLIRPYQTYTVKAFFEVRVVVENEALEPVKEKLNKIEALIESKITIDEVKQAFAAASCHLLNWYSFIDINEKIHIKRDQVKSILDWIRTPLKGRESKIILLTGDAGMGKTVVLKDVYENLIQFDIPVLGIKSDTFYSTNIEGLEKELNFRTSITEMIKILNKEYEKIVIIIDQIDALSQSLSTDRKFLSTYNHLVNLLNGIPNVRVVLSVRKFDLNYDPNLKIYKKNKLIEIGLLSEQEVKDVLKELQISIVKISKRLFETIRNPHHLYVFCNIYTSTLSIDGINELQDLYDELWRIKIVDVPSTTGLTCKECIDLIFEIAERMNEIQQINVERKLYETKHKTIDYLISANILVGDKKKIQFFHQTFFDYSYARHFVERGCSVVRYILEHSQTLHIRSSVKMILTYLRKANEKEYINSLENLLKGRKIRFHIKYLVINIIGFNQNPSEKEIEIAKRYLVQNKKLCKYFIESAFGTVWLEFVINEKILDNLLNIKKNKVDKIFESKILNKILKAKIPFVNRLRLVPYENRRLENINLIYLILYRSLPDSRRTVVDYLFKLPHFKEENWLVSRTLYALKKWDFAEAYQLYEKYKENLIGDTFSYCSILEDTAHYNMDWTLGELKKYIKEAFDDANKSNPKKQIDYHITKLYKEIIKIDPHKAFDGGIEFIKIMSDACSNEIVIRRRELYDDTAFWMYDYERERYHNKDDIYAEVIELAETFAKKRDQKFIDFYNSNFDNNSITILKVIVYAFNFCPDQYPAEIIRFIEKFDEKGGFNDDGKIQFWIKELLNKAYPIFSQNQKDVVNDIIMRIHYEYETRVFIDKDGKKRHNLQWNGMRKYKYLCAIPENEVLGQNSIKKVYQELKRKFGTLEKDEEPMSITSHAVGAPLSNTAYDNMSFENWEHTFIEFKSEDIFSDKGSMLEHSRAFCDCVKKQAEKFYPFVEKLINENNVKADYWVKGLEGLKDANYDATKLLIIYKKAIQKTGGRENTLYLIWLADYFIKNKNADDQIIDFLIRQALSNPNPERELNPGNPLQDGINSVRGAAIERLIRCSYNDLFKDKIFDTAEKTAKDKIVTVKAALLMNLAYLIRLDRAKTLKIFIKIMQDESEKLISTAIHPLRYLVHNDFAMLAPYLKKWIKYEKEQSNLGAIITWCWIKEYKGSYSLLKEVHKVSANARAMSVRIAHENLFHEEEKIKKKCKALFIKFINDQSVEVANEYDVMFLHYEKREGSFEKLLPYIIKYAKSRVARKNPHYFLEYILKNTSSYPNDCINLISVFRLYARPNNVTGPFYEDEPIKIVLNAYNVLNNKGDIPYIKKSIRLFDEMLRVDYLRKGAFQALQLVER
jgi:hypothetical protein